MINEIAKEVRLVLSRLCLSTILVRDEKMLDNEGAERDACTVGYSTVIREEYVAIPTIARPNQVRLGYWVERFVGTEEPYGMGLSFEAAEVLAKCVSLHAAVAVAIGAAMVEEVQMFYQRRGEAEYANELENKTYSKAAVQAALNEPCRCCDGKGCGCDAEGQDWA